MDHYCMNCMKKLEYENAYPCPHCGFDGDLEDVLPYVLPPGTLLDNGQYMVGNVIGRGGFGITYIGLHVKLGLRVAIKEYFPNEFASRNTSDSNDIIVYKKKAEFLEKGLEKFLEEARVLASLSGTPGVVEVNNFFNENRTAYIVMEYLEGTDLATYLAKGNTFSPDKAFRLMYPVMKALELVHEKNVIHRDISPDNIMLMRGDPKSETVTLMDFGAARIVDDSEPKSRSIVYKASYAPVEQIRGDAVGRWFDVYALCATIYKAITGQTPKESLQRDVYDDMKWPSELGIAISKPLEEILKKGLAVKRADRYHDFSELIGDLEKIDGFHTGKEEHFDDLKKERMQEGESERVEDKVQIENESGQENNVEVDEDKRKKQKRSLIGGTIAILAVVAALFLFVIIQKRGKLQYDEKTQFFITLTAEEQMSHTGFQEAVEILKDRVKHFANGSKYQFQELDNSVNIVIDQEAFEGQDVSETLIGYISRPIRLYFFEDDDEKTAEESDYVMFPRDEIESVSVKNGKIPVKPTGREPIEEGKDYQYVELVISDRFYKRNKEKLEKWISEGKLCIAQDIDHGLSSLYYFAETGEDHRTFYVVNSENLPEKFYEMTAYDWSTPVMEKAFYYNVAPYGMEWETVEEAPYKGKNQVNADRIAVDSVTIEFMAFQGDYLTGEWYDLEQGIKERLDCLEQPYSFGTRKENESLYVVIRTPLEHMGEPVMDWLSGSGLELRIGYTDISICQPKVDIDKDQDNYRVTIYSTDEEEMSKLKKWFSDPENQNYENIQVLLGGSMISQSAHYENGCIVLDHVQEYNQNDTAMITDENVWIANILKSVTETNARQNISFFMEKWQYDTTVYSKNNRATLGISKDAENEAIKKRIMDACPEASKISFNGNRVTVGVDVPINGSFASAFIKSMKDVYEAADFSDMDYEWLIVWVNDENGYGGERARAMFTKYYKDISYYDMYIDEQASDDDDLLDELDLEEDDLIIEPGICCSGFLYGGRMDNYIEEFKELKGEDIFFNAFTNSELSWKYSKEE